MNASTYLSTIAPVTPIDVDDPTRYFSPWTPIQVSPIGVSAFFGRWGAEVIVSEMIWVWAPLLVLGVALWMVRRFHRVPRSP